MDVVAAGLEQQHPQRRVLREPAGQRAAGRPRADDDELVALALVHTDLPPYCRTMSLAPETPLNVADDEAGPGAALETFDSLDPATGEVVGTFPVHGRGRGRGRPSSAPARPRGGGRALGFDGRGAAPAAWGRVIARRMHELAELMHRENGKPHADAMLEITLAIDHIAWAARNAARCSARAGAVRPARGQPGRRRWSTSRSAWSA